MLLPAAASAHEVRSLLIGDAQYDLVVGSLNEPTVVDDKAGVELVVSKMGSGSKVSEGVAGLENTLKVEVSAAGQKRVFDLAASWGSIGNYEAVFYPTRQASYTYRLFGTIDNVPLDLSFTCNAEGHSMHGHDEDTTRMQLSEGVTQISKTGSFGCPRAKEGMGFPDTAPTLQSLWQQCMVLCFASLAALVAGLLGLAFGIAAWRNRRPAN